MKLQISTKDHGVITSDELSQSAANLQQMVINTLTGDGCLHFYVKGVFTVVPYGVFNTSIIKIIE